MRYPKFLKKGDYIAVTAPSAGIVEPKKLMEYENAIRNLKNMGFGFLETKHVRTDINGRSASAKERAKEWMQVWQDEKVGAIICAAGGDFAFEILDELDFSVLKNTEPKWVQGFSDITNLGFILTTNLEIATIYGENIKDYGMHKLPRNLTDSISLMEGLEVEQKSFGTYEPKEEERKIFESYHLTKKGSWKNLKGEEKLYFSERCIGGCLDIIVHFFGTKYDKIKEYCNTYKEDGIVWFLDVYEMFSPQVLHYLWQMKNAGYFENCKGIIFGRPFLIREDYGMSFEMAVKEALGKLDIPIILDCDIGHIPPQMPIVNGAILEVMCEKGEGVIKTFLR